MKSVLTVATGKKVYIDMAVNLARSFLRWHQESDILFCLATDQPEFVPPDVRTRVRIIDLRHLRHITGFSIKLYLDQLTVTPYTLFIDADCLVYGRLEAVFEQFEGHSVSAIGDTLTEGEFFCDVRKTIQMLAVPYLPRFVGGIYYLEKNDTSQQVFEYARNLLPQYDDLGLVRLRGKENEEPLVAIAMAAHGQVPIAEDGSIKADRMFYHYCATNVLTGKARLSNPKSFPQGAYYHLLESNPLVVHYNNDFSENFEYSSEASRLYFSGVRKWSELLIEPWIKVRYVFPGKAGKVIKSRLRPYYRKVFGVRKVKQNKRLGESVG